MLQLLDRLSTIFTPQNIWKELETHPITTALCLILLAVFYIQIGVAYGHSAEAYRYWFVITPELSPGLLLGIISHSAVPGERFHVIENLITLFILGRLVEDRRSPVEYVALFLTFGYLTSAVQLGAELLAGESDPSSLGASGSIAGIAGVNFVWLYNKHYYKELSPSEKILFLTVIIFVVYWFSLAIVPGFGSSNTAHISHIFGVLLGVAYGIISTD